MNCLRGYIGMTACGADSSTSGLSFDTLEIINKRLISSIADEEQETYAGVMSDIETRAMLRISDDVRSEMFKKQRIRNVLKQYNLRRDNLSSSSSAPDTSQTRGIYISQNEQSGNGWANPLTSIYIQSAAFYADVVDVAKTAIVRIIDLDTGASLWNTTITIAEGWNEINIEQNLSGDYTNNAQRVYLCIDASDLNYFDKTIVYPIQDSYADGLTIYGAISDSGINDSIYYADVTTSANVYGMTVIASLKCSYDSVICQNKDLFKRAYLYALGIEAMREVISSDRINQYTTIGIDTAKENITIWTADYSNSLGQAIDGITVEGGSCVECHSTVMIKTAKGFY